MPLLLAGDAAYSQDLLLADAVDGVGPDPAAQHDDAPPIMAFAAQVPTIFLPSHDPDAAVPARQPRDVPAVDHERMRILPDANR